MASTLFDNIITFSRGSNATLTGPTGLIQWAPNNLVTFSEQFDNAAWGKTGLGTGSAPVVTANVAVAPDGTTTADLVVFNRGAGNAIGDRSTLSQLPTILNGYAYAATIYVKAATAGDIGKQLAYRGVAGVGYQVITLTNNWVRITTIETSTGTAGNFELASRGTVSADNQVSAHVWGAQLELGSTATTYNSTSVKNLLGFSEAFDNAGWTKGNSSIVTGAQANPINGLFNAQKLMENTATNTHQVQQGIISIVGTSYTASAYIKAAERTWVAVQMQSGTFAYINLATGAIGNTSGSPTVSVISLGGGWWRIGVTGTATATTSTFAIYAASGNGVVNYTGDGNSGVYIYGAQLSDSASLDPYVPTPGAAPSSTAYYGPRFDYDPVTLLPRGLLVEEQRTNIATYSNTFSDASWTAIGAKNLVSNSTVSPDGEVNASTLTDNSAVAFQGMSKTLTVANDNATYTASIYVRKTTGGTSATFGLNFQLTGGTLVGASPRLNTDTGVLLSGTGTVQNAGAYWRLTTTITNNTSGNTSLVLSVFPATAPNGVSVDSAAATGSAILYGAQLEAGSFATSYIPTIASQVTRSADVATITGQNFGQWYNQSQGGFVSQFDSYLVDTNTRSALSAYAVGATSNNILLINAVQRQFQVNNAGNQADLDGGTPLSGAVIRAAGAYAVNDFALSLDGGAVVTDTAGTVPTVDALGIGISSLGLTPVNGHIRNITYYPVRPSNTQTQGLSA